MKAESTVNRWAREMMAISRHSNDPVESRVAWTVAHWLRRVTEETRGWPGPKADIARTASLIRQEMQD
jgi:hypothetical protein